MKDTKLLKELDAIIELSPVTDITLVYVVARRNAVQSRINRKGIERRGTKRE